MVVRAFRDYVGILKGWEWAMTTFYFGKSKIIQSFIEIPANHYKFIIIRVQTLTNPKTKRNPPSTVAHPKTNRVKRLFFIPKRKFIHRFTKHELSGA